MKMIIFYVLDYLCFQRYLIIKELFKLTNMLICGIEVESLNQSKHLSNKSKYKENSKMYESRGVSNIFVPFSVVKLVNKINDLP